MFDPQEGPRLFALPPGADFPRLLVRGLLARMADRPPEALARVELYVNTRRMQRRIRAILSESGARLLPRLRLVTDPGEVGAIAGLPPPVPPLRRRLELMQLVGRLLERQPGLAPSSATFDLADSLARLMDEMQGEGVLPATLANLDVSAHSRHWQQSLAFIDLVQRYFSPEADLAPDSQARQRMAVEHLAARWAETPPEHPVIIAGSTGSRGTTARLMDAVSKLPQGALILPGFDFDMPDAVWSALDDALTSEDHPQYRYRALLRRLNTDPCAIRPWIEGARAPHPDRNQLISLALRPAPVTDQWMLEGRGLSDLDHVCAEMSLIEAPSPRAEALAIAMRLRKAAEDGVFAALITPDRGLTRQVTAALDRWRIVPDDSAGRPLALSAPGRFLRHVAGLFGQKLTVQALVTLLKHPLTHSAEGRGDHLRHSRDLELRLRARGPAFPDRESLIAWAASRGDDVLGWASWLGDCLDGTAPPASLPLAQHVARHIALAERLATGREGTDSGALWQKEAGIQASAAMDELSREASHGGVLTTAEYAFFFNAMLQGREVREAVESHPRIMIWGTLEARVQGADLVILGGLNEGVWPQLPTPDPWLNRQMRLDAGLLLPERQIGLAAHDFQQAAGAPEVVLSRCLRDSEAATVPSRWLNRLTTLLHGLPEQGGIAALEAMRARGDQWLAHAVALEADIARIAPAARPSPRPPVAARPRQLSVTAIERLIRDPYAIYARYILGLRALDPLVPQPDALLRGQVLHRVVEEFVQQGRELPRDAARARLLSLTEQVLAQDVLWPAARRLWAARLERVADWFLDRESARPGQPVLMERSGALHLPGLGFTLTARPDRIDALPDGCIEVMDYKTGAPPSADEQAYFAKQLLLEAVIAEQGGFAALGPREVARVIYIGLGASPREVVTEITPQVNADTLAGLERLIGSYMNHTTGYTARRAPKSERFDGDFDHLARLGEWEMSAAPNPQDVGGGEP